MKSSEKNIDFVVIGKITRPQGIKGEVRVLPLTIDNDRFLQLKEVFVSETDTAIPTDKRQVERVWKKKKMLVLKLSGCESYEDAELFRGYELKVPIDERITLAEDMYFWDDLLEMQVVSDEGIEIGSVKEIFPTGSNDVLVVRKAGKEILLPFINDVISKVDIEGKKITVHLLDGLV